MGSLVGSTEANIRQALRIADAMSPCILFCDEVEKALSGVANSGQTDSGVSARLFGSLLTWMNDHTTDVFLVATCNDISKLPPEFGRAERFDGIFFLNLPGPQERQLIWDLYLRQFELDPDQKLPNDEQWTGAEVRSLLPLGGLAGFAAGASRPERRAGGGDGCRVRRAVADLGQRTVPRRGSRWNLPGRRRSAGASPEGPPQPAEQLTCTTAFPRRGSLTVVNPLGHTGRRSVKDRLPVFTSWKPASGAGPLVNRPGSMPTSDGKTTRARRHRPQR